MSKNIWARVGMILKLTDEEIDAIFSESSKSGAIVRNAIAEGRYCLDGDSYIPESAVEDFNCTYDTEYECGDYDIST